MKKVFFLLALMPLFVLNSCSSDDDVKSTTYTLQWEMEDDTDVDVSAFVVEYSSENEKVASTTVDCYKGLSKQFTANEKAEKVKVCIKMEVGSYSSQRWVQQVF